MNKGNVQQGQQWLEQLMKFAGLPSRVAVDSPQDESDDSCWLTIDSASLTLEQVQLLIGADGAVLDSIQYLINTTLNLGQAEDQRRVYTVELDGYRVRRQRQLQEMAEAAAQRVRETGEEFELASLSSAERRHVHTFLKSFEDLETYSRGQEPDRRLVVKRLS